MILFYVGIYKYSSLISCKYRFCHSKTRICSTFNLFWLTGESPSSDTRQGYHHLIITTLALMLSLVWQGRLGNQAAASQAALAASTVESSAPPLEVFLVYASAFEFTYLFVSGLLFLCILITSFVEMNYHVFRTLLIESKEQIWCAL